MASWGAPNDFGDEAAVGDRVGSRVVSESELQGASDMVVGAGAVQAEKTRLTSLFPHNISKKLIHVPARSRQNMHPRKQAK